MSTQTSKQVFKQGVGFDVSKDRVCACFSQRETGKQFRVISTKSFLLTADGFEKIAQWLTLHCLKGVEAHLLMEASGIYYEELAYFLHGAGHRVSMVLPNKAKAFFKSLDHKCILLDIFKKRREKPEFCVFSRHKKGCFPHTFANLATCTRSTDWARSRIFGC